MPVANRPLDLPLITPELKSIAPYLQRADELKSQDPIMAYWCAYYAAQVGISIKAKDNSSRDVLFSLLGILERLKKDIGPSDAIDIEAASSAYVENFALRVFAMADNEDRSGDASRSTAKKFLAAANFLEVLKTFPKSEVSDSNEEKIRYAKWKAADLAKAFREGRKPTPGPAGQPQEPIVTPSASPPHPSNDLRRASPPLTSSASPPQIKRIAHIDITHASPPSNESQPQLQTPPRSTHLGVEVQGHAHLGRWGGEGEASPGSWSTAATPGTAQPSVEWEQVSPTRATDEGGDVKGGYMPGRDGGSSIGSVGSSENGGVHKKKAWVSEELEPHATNQYFSQRNGGISHDKAESVGSNGSKKSVRFTPSVIGGMSSDGAAPQISPVQDGQGHPGVAPGWHVDQSIPVSYGSLPPHPQSQDNVVVDMATLPPGFVPNNSSDWAASVPPPSLISPPSPPYQPSHYAPSPPQPPYISAPQLVPSQPLQNIYASAPPLELSPSIIAKAQKHCRFAISALDYEDAAQARKELLAALAALGG
ncbi:DUF605-domain-containing protein [Tricholoma matsutake]|nr:DUF605-domain-containing protein [Tricholoma matsutake 945]